jgi:flagellar basal-body rod protein FlgB
MHDIYGPNADLMAKVMDLRLERQNLVMSNLANINVTGYKARSLDFEKDLQEAVGSQELRANLSRSSGSGPKHFDPNDFDAEVLQQYKPRTVYGVDAVDMDKEMATMAKNSLMYNAMTTVVKSNFTDITKVITDGAK